MKKETLKQALTNPASNGLWLRERLMPRFLDGTASRPIEPPPGAPPAQIGAVLVLLYANGSSIHLPLTVRTAALRNHSGEVSLPGGRFDDTDRTLDQTALREAREELGIPPDSVEIWTQLTPVWIPVSNFQITPFVGWTEERPAFTPAPAEVAELIEVPLHLLLQPETIRNEERERRGQRMFIPYYDVGLHKVWGATSLILAELAGKLSTAAT